MISFKGFGVSDYQSGVTPDHAPRSKKHDRKNDRFIARQMKLNGKYDLEKIEQLILYLEKEKKSIMYDKFETELDDRLDLDLFKYKKAKKRASNEIDQKKSSIAYAYNNFLIPTLEEMIRLIESQSDIILVDSLADSFMWVYGAFYHPEKDRNLFNYDKKPFISWWKRLFGFNFKRNPRKYKVEANNLIVGLDYRSSITECIGPRHEGYYLKESELKKLRDHCHFDLSKLNPGKSPLIKLLKPHDYSQAMDLHQEWFPKNGQSVKFKIIKHSSSGSVKFKVSKFINGKKYKYKLKLGREVFSENVSTYLARYIGFHQDYVVYRKTIRMNLGKMDYSTFIAHWNERYNGRGKFFQNFITKHGISKNGEHYVIVRDVLLERKDPRKIRLEPFHPDNTDLKNRREFRSLLLWFGLLNFADFKAGNTTVNLVKNEDGSISPEYSIQDMGFSFGPNDTKHPSVIFKALQEWVDIRSPNAFEDSFIIQNQNKVKILWNDFQFDTKRFKTTTFSDLKWMARKIAGIPRLVVEKAFTLGGLGPNAEILFKIKLLTRINEVIKAFNLESEGFNLHKVPSLKHFSPNQFIKNGKLIQSHEKGSSRFEASPKPYVDQLLKLVGRSINFKKLNTNFQANLAQTFGLGADYQPQVWKNDNKNGIASMTIMPGIKLHFNRNIQFNQNWVVQNDSISAFVIKDTIQVEVGVQTNLLHKIVKNLPVTFIAGLKVWARNYEFVHFSPTYKSAIFKPFKLAKILFQNTAWAASRLKKEEALKIEDSYGFSLGATMSSNYNISMLKSSLLYRFQKLKSRPLFFYRDAYGELSVYRGQTKTIENAINLVPLSLDLWITNIELAGISFSSKRFSHTAELYTFNLDKHELHSDVLNEQRRKSEFSALYDLLNDGDSLTYLPRRKVDIKSSGLLTSYRLHFLNFFIKRRVRGISHVDITDSQNKKFRFHRYFFTKQGKVEKDFHVFKGLGHFSNNLQQTSVELEHSNIKNTLITHIDQKFKRKLNRKSLIAYINKLNRKYSITKSLPFFRDYTLHSKDQINEYRKIYSRIRIFIRGNYVLKHFLSLTDAHIRKLVKNALQENGLKAKVIRLNTMTRKLIRIKKDILANLDHPKKLVRSLGDFAKALNIEKWGSSLAKRLVGKKGIYVRGGIYGIYSSFSHIQINERTVGTKFAAKSWGKYKVIPPIRKFMRDHNILPMNPFVTPEVDTEAIFGTELSFWDYLK